MISFIVPAHNEEQLLGGMLRTLRGAADAVGEPYEVIVVDDASKDRTAEIARTAGARVARVNFRQIARTRNTGASLSRGDRLIFVDADTFVSEALIRASVAALDGGAVAGGATLRMDGEVPRWARGVVTITAAVMRRKNWFAGCYVFCTRAAFEASGGFDETLFASEEIALSKTMQRIGRVVLLEEVVTTSGRKARSHSLWDLVVLFTMFAVRGQQILRSRRDLDLWYGQRRDDPGRLDE